MLFVPQRVRFLVYLAENYCLENTEVIIQMSCLILSYLILWIAITIKCLAQRFIG
ncbi:hypothetical protein IAD21_01779 [Abditibacteriota bacterium]|nr:hypothetical protein IAD21_01779 [Abditibacteriota bacterium]